MSVLPMLRLDLLDTENVAAASNLRTASISRQRRGAKSNSGYQPAISVHHCRFDGAQRELTASVQVI